MQLHPAVAFGAALAGGSISGLLGAFMALPAAAVIQSTVSTYLKRHEVVETELTREDEVEEDETSREARPPREEVSSSGRFNRLSAETPAGMSVIGQPSGDRSRLVRTRDTATATTVTR